MSDNEEFESKVHIITVVYDEDVQHPVVDLGDVPPTVAVTMLQQTVAALFDCLSEPKITYNNKVIYSPIIFDDE